MSKFLDIYKPERQSIIKAIDKVLTLFHFRQSSILSKCRSIRQRQNKNLCEKVIFSHGCNVAIYPNVKS